MKLILILTTITTFSINAISFVDGQSTGNGGDVIVCGSSGVNVQLLDIYEAKEVKKLKIDLGSQSLTLDQKMEMLFDRVSTKSNIWADRMRVYYSTFMQEASFVENANLVDIDDSRHLAIPHGCEIEQIAIQKARPIDEYDPRYVINKNLWDALSIDHQAGLILHELIYRDLLKIGDSVFTRHMVGVVLSKKIEEMGVIPFAKSLNEYKEHLKASVIIDGVEVLIDSEISKLLFRHSGSQGRVNVSARLVGDTVIEGQKVSSVAPRNLYSANLSDSVALSSVGINIKTLKVETFKYMLGSNVSYSFNVLGNTLITSDQYISVAPSGNIVMLDYPGRYNEEGKIMLLGGDMKLEEVYLYDSKGNDKFIKRIVGKGYRWDKYSSSEFEFSSNFNHLFSLSIDYSKSQIMNKLEASSVSGSFIWETQVIHFENAILSLSFDDEGSINSYDY